MTTKTQTPTYTPRYSVSSISMHSKTAPIVDTEKPNIVPPRPKIFYTPEVQQKMEYLVDICKKEVGWMMLVDDSIPNTYILTDIYIPKQEVHATETEIEPEAMSDLAMELIDQGVDTTKMYAWFHSHVNMPVGPSSQDEEQLQEYLVSCPIFIRGIINKKGEQKIDIYFRDHSIAYLNMEVETLITPIEKTELDKIKKLVEDNVTEYVFVAKNYKANSANLPGPQIGKKNNSVNSQNPLDEDGWDTFDEKNYRTQILPYSLNEEEMARDTGYLSTWNDTTVLEQRPAGWQLDPYYAVQGYEDDYYAEAMAATMVDIEAELVL